MCLCCGERNVVAGKSYVLQQCAARISGKLFQFQEARAQNAASRLKLLGSYFQTEAPLRLFGQSLYESSYPTDDVPKLILGKVFVSGSSFCLCLSPRAST